MATEASEVLLFCSPAQRVAPFIHLPCADLKSFVDLAELPDACVTAENASRKIKTLVEVNYGD